MIRRLSGAVLVAVLIGLAGFASPASGHVTVDPEEAEQGGYARVAFRVPNERENASTTRVAVWFPKDQPVASVRTMSVPGWTVHVKYQKLNPPIELHGQRIDRAVRTLTWTALGLDSAIGENAFLEFPVSLGPLPEASTIMFKTLQTYSDGEVVRWVDAPDEGDEPEYPAPILDLAKPPGEGGAAPTQVAAAETGAAAQPEEASSGTPLWLGIVGLAAGLVALVLGLVAYGRTRPENSLFDEDPDEDGDDEPIEDDGRYEEDGFDDTTVDLSELDDVSQDDTTTERVHQRGRSR